MTAEVDIFWTGENGRGEMINHPIDHRTEAINGKKKHRHKCEMLDNGGVYLERCLHCMYKPDKEEKQ